LQTSILKNCTHFSNLATEAILPTLDFYATDMQYEQWKDRCGNS